MQVDEAMRKISLSSYFDSDDARFALMEMELKEVANLVKLFFENKFQATMGEMIALSARFGDNSIYSRVILSMAKFIFGIFSMESVHLQDAIEHIKLSLDNCASRRKNLQTVSSWFIKPNYDALDDIQAHAELIIAEGNFMLVSLTFLADASLLGLLKSALKMRTAYNGYKLCGEILEHKSNWKSVELKEQFECGYKLGWGFFNILITHLPTRILSILAFAGFSADRSVGLDLMWELTEEKKSNFRSKLGSFAFCTYTFYIEQYFGCGAGDLDWVQSITTRALEESPTSAFDLFWAARYEQLVGNADRAVELFIKAKDSQDEIKSLQNMCNWDLLWSHAIKCDWRSASACALELSENCDWSKATNLYQWACFQYMIMEEENDPSLLPTIEAALKSVPELRRRFSGKTLSPEKFAISKAEKYFEDRTMTLPVLELFYVWNIYSFSAKNKDILVPLMQRIDSKLALPSYSRDSGNGEHWVLLLLRGVCLKHNNRYTEAIECFNDILQNESSIQQSHAYIPPHAALEIGLTYLSIDNLVDSKRWLEKARDHYTGFLIESLVHLRIHGALSKIREKKRVKKMILIRSS